MTILFLDTETTGLPKSVQTLSPPEDGNSQSPDLPFADPIVKKKAKIRVWPAVIQFGFLQYTLYGHLINEGCTYVKPNNMPIQVSAKRLHSITNQIVRNHGVSTQVFLRYLRLLISSSDLIVCHNTYFDIHVLQAEFDRYEIPSNLYSIPHFCTMKSSARFMKGNTPGRAKWPSLEQLHMKLFDAKVPNAHNAYYDARATAKCYFELRARKVLG